MNNVKNEIELLEARIRILKAEAAAAESRVVEAGNYTEPQGNNTGSVMENLGGIAAEAAGQAKAAFDSAYSTAKSWWTGGEKAATGVVEQVVEAVQSAYSYCYRCLGGMAAAAGAAADRVGKAMQIAYLRGWKNFKRIVADVTDIWTENDLPVAKNTAYAAILLLGGGIVAALAGWVFAAQLFFVAASLLVGFALGVTLALPLVVALTATGFAAAGVVAAIYFAYDYIMSFAEELFASQANTAVAA